MGEHLGVNGEKCYGGKEERGRRQASRRKPENDRPVDMVGKMVTPTPGRLGDGGIEQVGADGRGRGDAEHHHQQRRHQRAASHAGDADDGAHQQAGNGMHEIEGQDGGLQGTGVTGCRLDAQAGAWKLRRVTARAKCRSSQHFPA
jgi:hypothetical protein